MARALHWVFKITNLKESYSFYTSVLKMRVLRHEEFGQGCEASCNGAYNRPWSKTMIGPGNEDDFFVFELTYNYGIRDYKKGNDLRYIAIKSDPEMVKRATDLNFKVEGDTIIDPDGYHWKLVETNSPNPVPYVSISVNDLSRSLTYYKDVLKMEVFESNAETALVGFSESQTKIQLVAQQDPVDHADAYGRIAFATPDIYTQHKAVTETNNKVLHQPVTLDTPGKESVQVVIIQDPDLYEICFVGDKGFRELSKLVPGADAIDWEQRAGLGADALPRRS